MAILTPAKLAESGTEDGTQRAILQELMQTWRPHYPELDLLYHVPNGGSRGDFRNAAIAGSKLNALGAKKGVPDLCLPVARSPFSSLYVEVKAPNGKGKLSSEQKAYIEKLAVYGNLIAIVDTWQVGAYIIGAYLQGNFDYLKTLSKDGILNAILDPSGYFR